MTHEDAANSHLEAHNFRSTESPQKWLFALCLLILFAFFIFSWLSVAQYRGYNLLAFDLGAISQATWSVAHGQALIYTHKGIALSRLAGQVEVIYFLLAPIYAIRPVPETLLIIQAGLFALGAWPVYRLVQRRLQSPQAALWLAGVYLLYPVANTAVLFEFHGDTIGMPLLLFAIEALDRRAWRPYAVWIMLALLSKFYVAVPVTALGVLLWWRGEKKWGVITAVSALIWGSVAFLVIRSHFAPPEIAHTAKATAGGYLAFYFGQLLQIGTSWLPRLANGFVVYTPAILLGRRAPGWLLVAAVIVLPVLASTGPGPSYNYVFHHYALAVPFLIAAVIYGAEKAKKYDVSGRGRITAVRFTFFITLLINAVAVNAPLNPAFYLGPFGSGQGMEPTSYGITDRDRFKDAWLERIPENTAVSADRLSALRLVNREMLVMNQPLHKPLGELLPTLDYVVVDALFDFVRGTPQQLLTGGVAVEHETVAFMLQQPDWGLVRQDDGLLLFQKGRGLQNELRLLTESTNQARFATFADKITLLDAAVQEITPHRYRFQFTWQAESAIIDAAPLMAVTELVGINQSRIVHLPTLAIYPTTMWQPGEIVQETFEWVMPEDVVVETAVFYTGWYETDNLYAGFTDERSRIGDLVKITASPDQ